jgi:light-regulated signal transduction histidine kinase (bacteriophytochrome)
MDGFSLALLEEYGDRLDEQGRQYLDRVRKGSQRMAQLIEDLLTLAKVARSAFERRSVDVSARAEEIVQRLQAADPGRDVQVSIESGLQADADAVLLGVVLENLLANAWKFTAHASAARIEVGRTETQHGSALFVRDNGAGFDMAHAAKLFGAFQRLHASSEYAGTGVGLAIVSRIVHRHGGRIWAEARPNEGATFYFTLEGGTS